MESTQKKKSPYVLATESVENVFRIKEELLDVEQMLRKSLLDLQTEKINQETQYDDDFIETQSTLSQSQSEVEQRDVLMEKDSQIEQLQRALDEITRELEMKDFLIAEFQSRFSDSLKEFPHHNSSLLQDTSTPSQTLLNSKSGEKVLQDQVTETLQIALDHTEKMMKKKHDRFVSLRRQQNNLDILRSQSNELSQKLLSLPRYQVQKDLEIDNTLQRMRELESKLSNANQKLASIPHSEMQKHFDTFR